MPSPVRRTRTPMIHAAAPRNHGGQRERRSRCFVTMCTGAQKANSIARPARRRTARKLRRAPPALAIAVEGDAVQLHAMIDEAEAELFGNSFLQRFELIVDEFDHIARFDVDQMVVMSLRRRSVA